MSNITHSESNIDPWPLDYVLSALQFLSLTNQEKCNYLPQIFPETLFHGNGGDYYSTSPLSTILSIYSDCVIAGASWNDWIGDEELEDNEIEELFVSLHTILSECVFLDDENDNIYRKKLVSENSDDWRDKILLCENKAKEILKKLELFEENSTPIFSATELLNEYSYGEYLKNI